MGRELNEATSEFLGFLDMNEGLSEWASGWLVG